VLLAARWKCRTQKIVRHSLSAHYHATLWSSIFATKAYIDKPVGFFSPIAPPGRNAPSSECPSNVVPNSEFRTCPDPGFPNALHSEFINMPNVKFLNVPLCSMPLSYLAANGVVHCPTGMLRHIGDCSEHVVLTAGT